MVRKMKKNKKKMFIVKQIQYTVLWSNSANLEGNLQRNEMKEKDRMKRAVHSPELLDLVFWLQ